MLSARIFVGVAALLLSAATALGHHPFSADFDANKPVTLDGTITKVEWTNPHAFVYVDVKDGDGATANWKVELGSRDELAGWTTPPLKAGQKISIPGWQAKNGSEFANAGALTIATGQKLSGGFVLLRQLFRHWPWFAWGWYQWLAQPDYRRNRIGGHARI